MSDVIYIADEDAARAADIRLALESRILPALEEEFGVAWVRVRVHKPGAIRGSKDVGVEIERGAMPD